MGVGVVCAVSADIYQKIDKVDFSVREIIEEDQE